MPPMHKHPALNHSHPEMGDVPMAPREKAQRPLLASDRRGWHG
jgi:hypothetical protein